MQVEPDFWEVSWQLEGEAFEILRKMGEEVTIEAQKKVFSEGDPGDSMYLVLEGYALVMSGGKDVVQGESEERDTLSIIPPGQSFGELALLIQQERLADVIAGTELKALKITRAALEKLEKESPENAVILYKKLAQTLSEQLVERSQNARKD